MPDLKVTQVRSTIGQKPKARGTMRALGLRGIGRTNTLPDRPEIRGMLRKVAHLVSVDETSGSESGTSGKAASKKSASVEEEA